MALAPKTIYATANPLWARVFARHEGLDVCFQTTTPVVYRQGVRRTSEPDAQVRTHSQSQSPAWKHAEELL